MKSKVFKFAQLLILLTIVVESAIKAQDVPERLEFGDIVLLINQDAKIEIGKRMSLLLSDKEKFNKKVEIANLFFPLVSEILEDTAIPEDFKYLALLDNTSPDSLIFWQMQDRLVKVLGLKVNNLVDERQNIVTLTKKIAQKLKEDKLALKSWVLTLLTYHFDLSQVKSWVQAEFPVVDLANLKTFPINKNTPADILEFIAIKLAFQSAIGKNLKVQTELINYTEGANKTFEDIAKTFALPEAEIKRFNPWLKSSFVPMDDAYDIVIPMPAESPSAEVNVYTARGGNLIYQTTEPLEASAKVHTVRSGQTLYRISQLYQVSVKDIMTWNGLNNSDLRVGQRLIVSQERSTQTNTESEPQKTSTIHQVQRGETLYRISRNYNVKVEDIRDWNNLYTNNLYVGQKLKINITKLPSTTDNRTTTDPKDKEDTKPSDTTDPKDTSDTSDPEDKEDTKPKPTETRNNNKPRVVRAKLVPNQIQLAGITLNISAKARSIIQKDVDRLIKNQEYFFKKLGRVDLYMPLIDAALESDNIPEDFKYLPIQESALIANAVSRSNAVGYWQFKAASAREVGIEVSNQVDERMNIIIATYGAGQYLRRNNLYFKNWLIALLSYNMGFTGAKNYVKRTYRNINLQGAKVMNITENTHWYIRKFLAHKIVFEYEIGLDKLDTKLVPYSRAKNKSLKQIADENKVDYLRLKSHNRWLKKYRVPSDRVYWVILPKKE